MRKREEKAAGWAAILLAFRNRNTHAKRGITVTTPVGPQGIDIAHENTSALDQPAEEWLRLATQYRAKGDLRFALRASYLATLATLSRSGWITLARGKSNFDYSRELERRARRLDAEFVPTFRANVGTFERAGTARIR